MESILSFTPSSHDDGATLVCRARSQALPAGKDTAITLNLQCERSWMLVPESGVLGEIVAWDLEEGGSYGSVVPEGIRNRRPAWTPSSKGRGNWRATPGVEALGLLGHHRGP